MKPKEAVPVSFPSGYPEYAQPKDSLKILILYMLIDTFRKKQRQNPT